MILAGGLQSISLTQTKISNTKTIRDKGYLKDIALVNT